MLRKRQGPKGSSGRPVLPSGPRRYGQGWPRSLARLGSKWEPREALSRVQQTGSGRRQPAVLQHILEHSTPPEPEPGSQHSHRLCPEESYSQRQAMIPCLPLGNKSSCPVPGQSCLGLWRLQGVADGKMQKEASRAKGLGQQGRPGPGAMPVPTVAPRLPRPPSAQTPRGPPKPKQTAQAWGQGRRTTRRTAWHTHCPLPPWLGDTTVVPRQLHGIDGPLQAKQDHCRARDRQVPPAQLPAVGEGSTHS